jgi:hypothetical protein
MQEKQSLGRQKRRWENNVNIRVYLTDTDREDARMDCLRIMVNDML